MYRIFCLDSDWARTTTSSLLLTTSKQTRRHMMTEQNIGRHRQQNYKWSEKQRLGDQHRANLWNKHTHTYEPRQSSVQTQNIHKQCRREPIHRSCQLHTTQKNMANMQVDFSLDCDVNIKNLPAFNAVMPSRCLDATDVLRKQIDQYSFVMISFSRTADEQ